MVAAMRRASDCRFAKFSLRAANLADAFRKRAGEVDHAVNIFVTLSENVDPQCAEFFLDPLHPNLRKTLAINPGLDPIAQCVDQVEPPIPAVDSCTGATGRITLPKLGEQLRMASVQEVAEIIAHTAPASNRFRYRWQSRRAACSAALHRLDCGKRARHPERRLRTKGR